MTVPEGFVRVNPFAARDIPEGFVRVNPFEGLPSIEKIPDLPKPSLDSPVVAPAASTAVDIDIQEEKIKLAVPKPVYETVYKTRRISKFAISVLGKPETIPFKVETEESKAARKQFIFDLTGRTKELPPLEYEMKRFPTGRIKGEQQFASRRVATLDSKFKRAMADIGRPLTLDEMEEIGGKDTFLNNVGVGLRSLKN